MPSILAISLSNLSLSSLKASARFAAFKAAHASVSSSWGEVDDWVSILEQVIEFDLDVL